MSKSPVLVIHGGAGGKPIDAEKYKAYRASLETIVSQVFPRLRAGLSSVEAVVAAVELLENDPLYNAGKGSKIQSDGKIRMSAAVCDGYEGRFGGCLDLQGVKNPIRLAEALMKEKDRVLAGVGAQRFARRLGLPFSSAYTERCREDFLKRKSGKSGTVGAIALDRQGRLAAATSTGGRGFEYPHRVSDTPTVAGNFATPLCAVSATGTGERIVEFGVASFLCGMIEAGMDLESATKKLMRTARKRDAHFGLIALDRSGGYIASVNDRSLVWAAATREGREFFAKS